MRLSDALSILFERHAQALLGSLGRLARQPFATALTIVVIGIALALPAALYVVGLQHAHGDRRARRDRAARGLLPHVDDRGRGEEGRGLDCGPKWHPGSPAR